MSEPRLDELHPLPIFRVPVDLAVEAPSAKDAYEVIAAVARALERSDSLAAPAPVRIIGAHAHLPELLRLADRPDEAGSGSCEPGGGSDPEPKG